MILCEQLIILHVSTRLSAHSLLHPRTLSGPARLSSFIMAAAAARFEGQVAIVTGGADGLGKGITARLLSEGAKVGEKKKKKGKGNKRRLEKGEKREKKEEEEKRKKKHVRGES